MQSCLWIYCSPCYLYLLWCIYLTWGANVKGTAHQQVYNHNRSEQIFRILILISVPQVWKQIDCKNTAVDHPWTWQECQEWEEKNGECALTSVQFHTLAHLVNYCFKQALLLNCTFVTFTKAIQKVFATGLGTRFGCMLVVCQHIDA